MNSDQERRLSRTNMPQNKKPVKTNITGRWLYISGLVSLAIHVNS